mgnify:CR=1 FL=1
MSGGQRQRTLIARALAAKPDILILDEPGTGLDIYARDYVLHAIDDLAKNSDMTIIYVTHYAEEILPSFDALNSSRSIEDALSVSTSPPEISSRQYRQRNSSVLPSLVQVAAT